VHLSLLSFFSSRVHRLPAPLTLSNPQAVQHICRPWNPVTNVSLVNEDVVLTQSDMDASNFGVGLDGRAVLFDTANIQALPVTLADFTLLRTAPFATAVSKHLFGAKDRAARLKSPSLESLARVRQFLIMTSDDSLGMFSLACFCFVPGHAVLMKPPFLPAGVDENGNRRTRRASG
jgi:hypothetical protein